MSIVCILSKHLLIFYNTYTSYVGIQQIKIARILTAITFHSSLLPAWVNVALKTFYYVFSIWCSSSSSIYLFVFISGNCFISILIYLFFNLFYLIYLIDLSLPSSCLQYFNSIYTFICHKHIRLLLFSCISCFWLRNSYK